jgi:aryl-alcohol dehydrogenase-like predicted oxidoreductase
VQAIVDDLGITREELPEVALRYVLSRPEVSTVIPGMRPCATSSATARSATGRACPRSAPQR